MNWQCRPQAARPFIQRTQNNTDNRLLKEKETHKNWHNRCQNERPRVKKKTKNRKLLFIYIKCNTFKCFYHSKSTGVRLGLVARLIESGSFLCCTWDPPGCQSALILFGFPLILPLLWDEHWAPLTSKTCLKHYLALSIKVRATRQGCAATRQCDKAAMTDSQLHEQKVTITVRVWLCFKFAIISVASEGESRWYSEEWLHKKKSLINLSGHGGFWNKQVSGSYEKCKSKTLTLSQKLDQAFWSQYIIIYYIILSYH